MTGRLRRALPAAMLCLALLGAWEVYVDAGGVQAAVLPAPHAVASALWHGGGVLWRNLAGTPFSLSAARSGKWFTTWPKRSHSSRASNSAR